MVIQWDLMGFNGDLMVIQCDLMGFNGDLMVIQWDLRVIQWCFNGI